MLEILQDKTDGDKCLKCPDLSLFETYGGSCVASKCVKCMVAEKKRLDTASEPTYTDLNCK